MKRFPLSLSALGVALAAVGLAVVLAGSAQAKKALVGRESGQPVIDWNQILLSIVNTPGAQPANIQPTRNFAIVHAAIYDAVNSIDRSHQPYLISVRAPRDASETAAADAAASASLSSSHARMPAFSASTSRETSRARAPALGVTLVGPSAPLRSDSAIK